MKLYTGNYFDAFADQYRNQIANEINSQSDNYILNVNVDDYTAHLVQKFTLDIPEFHFDNFINRQIQSGRFSSASEVVRTALRLFEQEENQRNELIKDLKKGEKSGFVQKFDREKYLKNLHGKYLNNGL